MKMDPFIEAEEVTGHSVKRCCELFEVSRAAHYQRRKQEPSARAVSDAELSEQIREVHAESDGTYGSPRVHHELVKRGVACGRRRVRRLMRLAGLAVPILRNTDGMSLAGIEKAIGDYAAKAKDGKLTIEDMSGGTFSITNGGTFGSMMSTPILNPPQSAILGMHNIVERAVVENGQIVARPMMYLALSYDHRIIDGREAVLFLVAIKKMLEDPARLLLDL